MYTSYYTPTVIAMNSQIDAIVEYFKDYTDYQYCTDLTMDCQLKFKGKPVIAYIGQPAGNGGPRTTKNSVSSDDIKNMFNNFYCTGKYNKETAYV